MIKIIIGLIEDKNGFNWKSGLFSSNTRIVLIEDKDCYDQDKDCYARK
jgi:hypothetical protein